jgi:spore coat polysaccharide biosynthesis protein SpsF
VVTVGDGSENSAIETYCERRGVDYSVGPEANLLTRHLAVAAETDCDRLVRITADCPFVPPNEIDRVVEEHLSNDARYTTNVTEDMPIGTAVDVIEPELLTALESVGETHPVKLARSNPEQWETVWSDASSWESVSDVDLAVDTPTDYWKLSDAIEVVGDDPFAVAEWVAER